MFLVGAIISLLAMIFGYLIGSLSSLKWNAVMVAEFLSKSPQTAEAYLKFVSSVREEAKKEMEWKKRT